MSATESGQRVELEVKGSIATVTWCRPNAANSFNVALVRQLASSISDLNTEHSVEVCILQGCRHHFSGGWDLKELRETGDEHASEDLAEYFDAGTTLLDAITAMGAMMVTRHRGVTAGFGIAIAARCDIVVAAPDSSFVCPEISVGLVPRLLAAELIGGIGERQALTWLASGRSFTVVEAVASGLVTMVLNDEGFDSLVADWQNQTRSAPGCLRKTKATVGDLGGLPIGERRGRAITLAVNDLLPNGRS